MRKSELFFLSLIFLGAFITRLYRLDNPLADWHSWRQADTSAVSRNFVKYGFDVFHPRFDDLSNVASGQDNPQGYRFVEFPLYNLFQAGLYLLVGFFSIEQWGRLVSIFFSCLSVFFLYKIVLSRSNRTTALLSAFFFAFLPYNIYYGRTILPDSAMVFAMLGGIYFFQKWIKDNSTFSPRSEAGNILASQRSGQHATFALAVISTAAAFLLKPYALFFTLPIIYLAFERFGVGFLKKWQLWLFMILVLSPFILWRMWIANYPEGVPESDWLFNGGNIRFKGAYFYWIFGDRIGRLILGYFGLAMLISGLTRSIEIRARTFFLSFLASSLMYLTIIARGNVQHDYYQVLIIPTVCIFLALGSELFLFPPKGIGKLSSRIALGICMLFMGIFGWYFVRDYFNINNHSMIVAGRAADRLVPLNAKVIAPYEGDTSFLYQTNRRGWASFQQPLPEMIQLGAEYLILLDPKPQDFSGIGSEYKVVSATREYVLFNLKEKP